MGGTTHVAGRDRMAVVGAIPADRGASSRVGASMSGWSSRGPSRCTDGMSSWGC